MQFARQLGVEWVMTGLPPEESTLENYQALIRRFAAQGLKIYRLANDACHNMEQVTLNLPGRDDKIDEYLAYIRLLGKAGIHYSTYAHMGNGIWSSERGRNPRRRNGPSAAAGDGDGPLGGQDLAAAAVARPPLYRGRAVGQLHVLHPQSRAGRGGSGRLHRHSPRRSAGL